jgi:hypothetical protein
MDRRFGPQAPVSRISGRPSFLTPPGLPYQLGRAATFELLRLHFGHPSKFTHCRNALGTTIIPGRTVNPSLSFTALLSVGGIFSRQLSNAV